MLKFLYKFRQKAVINIKNVHEYSDRTEKLSIAAKYFLMLALFSFLGCIMETVVCSLPEGIIYDCGFLTLPFCPIYGICLIILYLMLGTPNEAGGILTNVRSAFMRVFLYVVFSFIIPTAAELIIGVFADKVLGVSLWNYYMYPLNFYGYICLPVSLIWAAAIPLFMRFIFYPVKKLYMRIPDRAARVCAYVLAALMITDLTVNLGLLLTGNDLLAAYLFHIYQ